MNLEEEAQAALENGELVRALGCFVQLEKRTNDPEWARKAAEVLHQLGDTLEEVEALNRAAREYAKRGAILKSAVLSKQILQLNPNHIETLRRVPELKAAREEELKNKKNQPPPAKTPEWNQLRNEALAVLSLKD